jgi:RNA polymerase sigma-70 factor (ECF subfamily)
VHASDDSEAELVALLVDYQAGQRAAFERLYGRLAGELERFLGAVLRDPQVVRDLVQETFLELHRSRRTYRPPLPVRPWVFGVARNVVRRHRRDAARRARLEGPARDEAAGPGAALFGSRAAALDLERALALLPPGKREAWLLHHGEGLSFKEIARRLGIGVGNAKLRSSRAMGALRAFFGAHNGASDGPSDGASDE